MTIAVCVNCGSTKHGAFNPCDACNRRPESELDIAYSLALTDHYFSIDVLYQISADMRLGNARPSLPKEQEDHFREAARAHIERFGETFNLPPPNDPNMRRRCAKFAGWTRGTRPAMISSLKWRAGFGWIALGLLLVTCAAAILSGGILRVLAV